MIYTPISEALQVLLGVGFTGLLIVMSIMYLGGYWSPERVYRRWLMGDSFAAIDARHALGINLDSKKS